MPRFHNRAKGVIMEKKYPALKGNRYHKNADITSNTSLLNAEHETNAGICSVCIKCGACEIGARARTGKTIFPAPFGIAQFGAEKRMASLQDLQIMPEIFGDGIVFTKVNSSSKIGGFEFSAPISIAAMGSTKVAHLNGEAIAAGAALAGISCVIGENVHASYDWAGLKARMTPFLDNYQKKGAIVVQANAEDRKAGVPEKAVEMGAHAIELKFGQGAKMGLGGEIKFEGFDLAKRFEKMGFVVVKNEDGSYQRHSYPGDISKEIIHDLLVKYADLGVPLWIKAAFGHGIVDFLKYINELKKKEKLPVAAVTVDGFGGGTGMSPWLIMNECSLPSIIVLKHLKNLSYDLLVAGGFSTGNDVAKAMMLGASGVSLGRAMLIAANTNGTKGIVNFVDSVKEDIQMVCATQKVNNFSKLIGRRDNLVALNNFSAELFGVKTEVM